MDAALCVGTTGKVQLDSGLAIKLKDAAVTCGPHSVPVGSSVSNGMLWATLICVWRVRFMDPTEYIAVYAWLEQAYSAELSARAQAALPLVQLPAVTAPPINATSSAAAASGVSQTAPDAATIAAVMATLGVAQPAGSPDAGRRRHHGSAAASRLCHHAAQLAVGRRGATDYRR